MATTYEWKHGEPPLKIELPQLVNYTFDEEEEAQGIDFNVNGADIDFGDLTLGGGDEIQLETG